MDEYVPEVGQMLFGQPAQQHEVPDIMLAVLESLASTYAAVGWNIHQRQIDNPFYNSGPHDNLKTDVFEVCAYSWGDEEQPYNFAWRGLRISWYKHCGRGCSSNIEVTRDMAAQCLEECQASLWAIDAERRRAQAVGQQIVALIVAALVLGAVGALGGYFLISWIASNLTIAWG
jgi:predicted nucleic acid-binding Zn ribbon protein